MKELRDKIAKENSFDDWDDLCFHYGELCSINRFDKLTKFVDEFAQRYAQQYIDVNKELVEMLEELLKELRFHGFNYSTAICKAESLIAKNK